VSPPSLTFPTFDDITFPTSPGEAPAVEDIEIPDIAAYTIPDAPTWDAITIPTMPSYITPNFEGTRPVLPVMDTPGQVFFYEEGQFSSPLWDALQAQLADDLLNGGDVSAILETAGVFAQQERWIIDERERKKEEVRATFAAMGYARLPGAALAQIRLVELDAEKSLESYYTQATAKKADLTVQNRQFTIEKAVGAVVQVALEVWNQSNNRALQAAQASVAATYQDVDARVKLYNLALAQFQADAALFEAKIKATLAELDAYKTEMEGAQIQGQLRDSDVKVYLGKLQAVGQIVEIYKGRLQGAATQAEVQKARLQAYETSVQAYASRVNAVTAQFNAKVAQITGEKAKAEVYSEQVKAYGVQVEGAKTQAEIGQIQAGIVAQRNQSNVQLFSALVDQYKANWSGVATLVEKAKEQSDNLVKLYASEVQGVASDNDSKTRKYSADTQLFASQLDSSIKEANLLFERCKAIAELNERALSVIAQVSGQGLASALGQVHGTASLSSSDSTSASTSTSTATTTSTSTSTSTSHSSSYNENYNYSQSVSV